jgi:hypothetical protein
MCQTYGLSIKEIAMAYLIADDFSPVEAYSIIYSEAKAKKDSATIFARKPAIQALALKLKSKREPATAGFTSLEHDQPVTNQRRDFSDKSVMLDELNKLAARAEDKDRPAILKQIADLQRLKEEKEENLNKTVHFYVPFRCKSCQKFSAAQKNQAELKE